MQSSATPARQTGLQLPTARPLVTYAFLAAIGIVFVAIYYFQQTADDPNINPIFDFGVIDYTRVLVYGEWYRLFTAMFIHLSIAHIFFNAWALYMFGRTVEGVFGHVRFALVYLLGGLCGSLASLIIGRGASAGASGAIFAILAAEMVFLYWHRELLGERAGRALRELLIIGGLNLGLGILSNVSPSNSFGVIDNWAHIGGFIGGLLVSLMIAPRFAIQRDLDTLKVVDERPLSTRWPLAAIFALALIGIALLAARSLPRPV